MRTRMSSAIRPLRSLGAMLLIAWATGTHAQVVLESVSNAAVPGSGPATDGPSAAAPVVVLRHNADNPTGNTMTARSPAVTVTYRLLNQQFSGLTSAEGYSAGTGGDAVFFGGFATLTGNAPAPGPIYEPLNGLGVPTASDLTSTSAPAGQGIDPAINAGVRLAVSANAIAVRAPATPTTARIRMADLELTFSTPIDNPVLHLVGLGGALAAPGGQPQLGITAEFDLLTTPYTLTRLSGNSNFSATTSQINNLATTPRGPCTTGGACGSVRVNGTGITVLVLRVYLRGNGAAGDWSGVGGAFNMDGLLLGVSLNEPTPTVTVRKTSRGGAGTFNFSGNNGYAATAVTTTAADTTVSGATRTLAAAEIATTLTEAATPGYRLSQVSCTGLGAGGTATPSVPAAGVAGGGSVVLDASATRLGSNIVCTFTNERLPTLRLQKSLPNGRFADTDQFVLQIASGATVLQSVTTTGTGSTASQAASLAPAATGTAYTLSETGAAGAALGNYGTTWGCANTRAGGGAPTGAGSTFTVTPDAGDELTCTFTNVARRTDVAITKSASSATVPRGDSVQFTLLVSNNGAVGADGTRVVDPPVPGLSCSTVSCVPAGGAACPASPTVAALQTAPGLVVPTLPAGGSVSLQLSCAVTASGFSP